MILIADTGATKTDWRMIAGERISQFESPGFNPVTDPLDTLEGKVPEALIPFTRQISKLYFYGAGVAGPNTQAAVKIALAAVFPEAEVEVNSDLLGAARSLFGKDTGVVCILGTGSAACRYDGEQVSERVPSLGYLLGDEGSGFYFGKTILNRYLRGLLPDQLKAKFETEFGKLDEHEVLRKVYGEHAPKNYLADFARFVISYQTHPYLYQLVYDGLHFFFKSYFMDISKLKDQRIRFTGSIAHFLSNILLKVARDNELTIDLISQKPIAGLALYHRENG